MKTNPIYNALNNVDDKFVSEAAKSRGKRPIALAFVAAAAVILVLGVGFADRFAGIFGVGKDTFTINNSMLTTRFDLHVHEITIPKEFEPREVPDFDYFEIDDMKPSELFAKFGVSPLMNENFTESAANGRKLSVLITGHYIEFWYLLHNNALDIDVSFTADYDILEMSSDYSFDGCDEEYEVVMLNDGSPCAVSPSSATFAYDGVFYRLTIYSESKNNTETKQVLTDLGVL